MNDMTVVYFDELKSFAIEIFIMIEWCVWDAEQTLYNSTPELDAEVHKRQYEIVAEYMNIDFDTAKDIFDAERAKQPGATATFVALGIGRNGAREALDLVNKKHYLSADKRLGDTFKELKAYKHAIVTNASRKALYGLFDIVELDSDIFDVIITADDVESYKPQREPFLKFLKKARTKPELCVSIGNNDGTDIIPAKSLGMKTILVWGESKIADYSSPTVYDVPLYVKKIAGSDP